MAEMLSGVALIGGEMVAVAEGIMQGDVKQ